MADDVTSGSRCHLPRYISNRWFDKFWRRLYRTLMKIWKSPMLILPTEVKMTVTTAAKLDADADSICECSNRYSPWMRITVRKWLNQERWLRLTSTSVACLPVLAPCRRGRLAPCRPARLARPAPCCRGHLTPYLPAGGLASLHNSVERNRWKHQEVFFLQ